MAPSALTARKSAAPGPGTAQFKVDPTAGKTPPDDDDREIRSMATALLLHFQRLFMFLEEEGVEPSFGNRSRNGEIATARLLNVAQTCKRQRRHVLSHLPDAVLAIAAGRPLCSPYWSSLSSGDEPSMFSETLSTGKANSYT